MLRKKLLFPLASFAMLAPSLAIAQLSGLTIQITNALPATGSVEVTLFNSKESFMKEAYLQQVHAMDENDTFTVTFPGVEEGEYAVVVVHDENGNEKYDAGFLGIGAENLGYSNNVRPLLGRPDFDDIKVTVGPEPKEIEIQLD